MDNFTCVIALYFGRVVGGIFTVELAQTGVRRVFVVAFGVYALRCEKRIKRSWAQTVLFFVKTVGKITKKNPRFYRKCGNLQILVKIFQKGIYK